MTNGQRQDCSMGLYKNFLTTSHLVRKLFVQKGVKYWVIDSVNKYITYI